MEVHQYDSINDKYDLMSASYPRDLVTEFGSDAPPCVTAGDINISHNNLILLCASHVYIYTLSGSTPPTIGYTKTHDFDITHNDPTNPFQGIGTLSGDVTALVHMPASDRLTAFVGKTIHSVTDFGWQSPGEITTPCG